jgi:hypothetical protein
MGPSRHEGSTKCESSMEGVVENSMASSEKDIPRKKRVKTRGFTWMPQQIPPVLD